MTDQIIRTIDSDDPAATLLWDTVWSTDLSSSTFGVGDWSVATIDDAPGNFGGLSALHPVHTAMLLCLMTDKRRPSYIPSPDGSEELRGWHGDTFDLDTKNGEREMGSWLWTLSRSALDDQTKLKAKHYAIEALQTLIDQKVVSKFDIEVTFDMAKGKMFLGITAYAPDGEALLSDTFSIF